MVVEGKFQNPFLCHIIAIILLNVLVTKKCIDCTWASVLI